MRKLSVKQKLYAIMIIIVGILLFFANGVAFNSFASPTLASDIVAYAATTVAVALTIITLAMVFVEKRKIAFPTMRNAPVFETKNITIESKVAIQKPVSIQESKDFKESCVEELKDKSTQRIITPTELSIMKGMETIQVNTEKSKAVNKDAEVKQKKDVTTCTNCNKEFSKPIFMIDYSDSNQPNLVEHCPYCDHPLESKQKDTNRFESSKVELETLAVKSNIEKKPEIKQDEAEAKKYVLICFNCNKEVSQPIFMVDYSEANLPKLVRHCPYCDKSIDTQKKSTMEEDVWKNYV